MRYRKNPKYGIDLKKLKAKKEDDLTVQELYRERLKKKSGFKR